MVILLDTEYSAPIIFCDKSEGGGYGWLLHGDLNPEIIRENFELNGINLPLEVCIKIVNLWNEMKLKYTESKLTVEEYKEQNKIQD